ncbi:hypothetical protein OPV22_005107 [Ensete ventricosum]|uniref:HMA domain-containing protein n=1 Tax=Ensete ventricosum TaxID=4639 RepID=A0AAV8Q1W0_ENSVE|nr:hypothetical protein OPV22_005107 [Ensete ventricosum]
MIYDMSESKSSSKKESLLELKVYMHCKACERSVHNTLRKLEGVKAVKVDMNSHRAIVTGEVDPEKVVKKLKKKTGKRAEIITTRKNDMAPAAGDCSSNRSEASAVITDHFDQTLVAGLSLFSDENPNACSIT